MLQAGPRSTLFTHRYTHPSPSALPYSHERDDGDGDEDSRIPGEDNEVLELKSVNKISNRGTLNFPAPSQTSSLMTANEHFFSAHAAHYSAQQLPHNLVKVSSRSTYETPSAIVATPKSLYSHSPPTSPDKQALHTHFRHHNPIESLTRNYSHNTLHSTPTNIILGASGAGIAIGAEGIFRTSDPSMHASSSTSSSSLATSMSSSLQTAATAQPTLSALHSHAPFSMQYHLYNSLSGNTNYDPMCQNANDVDNNTIHMGLSNTPASSISTSSSTSYIGDARRTRLVSGLFHAHLSPLKETEEERKSDAPLWGAVPGATFVSFPSPTQKQSPMRFPHKQQRESNNVNNDSTAPSAKILTSPVTRKTSDSVAVCASSPSSPSATSPNAFFRRRTLPTTPTSSTPRRALATLQCSADPVSPSLAPGKDRLSRALSSPSPSTGKSTRRSASCSSACKNDSNSSESNDHKLSDMFFFDSENYDLGRVQVRTLITSEEPVSTGLAPVPTLKRKTSATSTAVTPTSCRTSFLDHLTVTGPGSYISNSNASATTHALTTAAYASSPVTVQALLSSPHSKSDKAAGILEDFLRETQMTDPSRTATTSSPIFFGSQVQSMHGPVAPVSPSKGIHLDMANPYPFASNSTNNASNLCPTHIESAAATPSISCVRSAPPLSASVAATTTLSSPNNPKAGNNEHQAAVLTPHDGDKQVAMAQLAAVSARMKENLNRNRSDLNALERDIRANTRHLRESWDAREGDLGGSQGGTDATLGKQSFHLSSSSFSSSQSSSMHSLLARNGTIEHATKSSSLSLQALPQMHPDQQGAVDTTDKPPSVATITSDSFIIAHTITTPVDATVTPSSRCTEQRMQALCSLFDRELVSLTTRNGCTTAAALNTHPVPSIVITSESRPTRTSSSASCSQASTHHSSTHQNRENSSQRGLSPSSITRRKQKDTSNASNDSHGKAAATPTLLSSTSSASTPISLSSTSSSLSSSLGTTTSSKVRKPRQVYIGRQLGALRVDRGSLRADTTGLFVGDVIKYDDHSPYALLVPGDRIVEVSSMCISLYEFKFYL